MKPRLIIKSNIYTLVSETTQLIHSLYQNFNKKKVLFYFVIINISLIPSRIRATSTLSDISSNKDFTLSYRCYTPYISPKHLVSSISQ